MSNNWADGWEKGWSDGYKEAVEDVIYILENGDLKKLFRKVWSRR